MNLSEHVREFLGETVDESEARSIATAVIANTLRSLKLAIAERLWRARQASRLGDQPASAEHLGAARSLKQRYDAAWAAYRDAAGAAGESFAMAARASGADSGSGRTADVQVVDN